MDYVNCGHVTAYGPGLTHGVVNKPAVFTVNTKAVGGEGVSLGERGLLWPLAAEPAKRRLAIVERQGVVAAESRMLGREA